MHTVKLKVLFLMHLSHMICPGSGTWVQCVRFQFHMLDTLYVSLCFMINSISTDCDSLNVMMHIYIVRVSKQEVISSVIEIWGRKVNVWVFSRC